MSNRITATVEFNFKSLKTGLDPDVIVGDILRPINAGLVLWKELSFTKADLKREERMAWARKAENNFLCLKRGMSANVIGYDILNPIKKGLVSWNELTFTENDVEREMRMAWIRNVEHQFQSFRSAMDAWVMSGKIRYPVSVGLVSWEELSFTEAQLIQKERAFCT
jgi:hypothetical protein